MNTPPPSDSESAGFNGFGSYRRKRGSAGAGDAPRSFRRIPREEFSDGAPPFPRDRDASEPGEAASDRPERPFGKRKPFGKKPFGKKPFGKKPFGKKPYGFKKGPGFRKPFRGKEFDGADAGGDFEPSDDVSAFRTRDGDREGPHADRSFKHAPKRFSKRDRDGGDGEGSFRFHRHGGHFDDSDEAPRGPFKPFGKKPSGKKPFGKKPFAKKGPRPFREHSGDGESDFGAPRSLRRPYGASEGEAFLDAIDFDAAPPPDEPHSFGKKPFGKKPFGKKPFGKKPFGAKPFGKKPFGKKPFGKGKPFGKKPFGRKPGKRPGPRD